MTTTMDFMQRLRELEYSYRPQKAQLIRLSRGISLEEVIAEIKGDGLVWVELNPNYPGQYALIVIVGDRYLYVPVTVYGVGTAYIHTAYPYRRIRTYAE